jgi:HAD superfamily hydrolase (TIGR01549 family)
VNAVVFDLGETLLDERRHWAVVARAVGVDHELFWERFEDVVARGLHHHAVFDELGVEQPELRVEWQPSDLYPDAVHCLARLREGGYAVGVAANQPPEAEEFCRRLFPFDLIGISALWGVHKPAPEFFSRISESLLSPPEEIAYVGDRVDNDVEPALAAGMTAVHLRRGPWGRVREAPREAIVVDSLHELPEVFE